MLNTNASFEAKKIGGFQNSIGEITTIFYNTDDVDDILTGKVELLRRDEYGLFVNKMDKLKFSSLNISVYKM